MTYPRVICDRCMKDAKVSGDIERELLVECHGEIQVWMLWGNRPEGVVVWSNIQTKFQTDGSILADANNNEVTMFATARRLKALRRVLVNHKESIRSGPLPLADDLDAALEALLVHVGTTTMLGDQDRHELWERASCLLAEAAGRLKP